MFKDELPLFSAVSRYALLRSALGLLMLLTGGCASSSASLELTSDASTRRYAQQFSRAYYSIGEGGEYDIVLSEDGIVASSSKPNGPITTAAAAPLNQTVHIRMQWRPMRGSKPDAPTATNAVIDWYVRANDPAGGDHLHYRGAGFVQLYGSDPEVRFMVRNAHVELTGSAGKLNDPLGPSSLTGNFLATRDDAQVSAALNRIREQFAARPAAQPTGYDGPPPRIPTGP